MALNRLLSLIASEGIDPKLDAVSRWTETPGVDTWGPDPEYGTFVDDKGMVVFGNTPSRAFMESDDPTRLELAPETDRSLGDGVTLIFLDWGRQSLKWEAIFELWESWVNQDRIADCGAVGVPWSQASRWISPGWIAFRGIFDGSPLSTVVSHAAETPSFLAKALLWRGTQESSLPTESGEPLPMLPFTLEDLKNPVRSWPRGVVQSAILDKAV